MPAWGYPSCFQNNRQWGRIIPPRGLIHDIRFESNTLEAFNPVLAWQHGLSDAGQTLDDRIVRIYRDGNLERTILGLTRCTVPGLRPDTMIDYAIEPLTPMERENMPPTKGFQVYPVGDRALVTWTESTASDFSNYKLYWNNGIGTATGTLLITIKGSKNISYITPQMTNGVTYYFKLSMTDFVGNESSQGTVSNITPDMVPLQLTNATISYSSITRKATISATQPASQHSDVKGALLFDNQIPGTETFSENPNVEIGWQRAVSYVATGGSAVSLTTPELHVGQWKLTLRAVDKYSNLSPYQVFTLNLIQSGGTVQSGSIVPLIPQNLAAVATASGKIVLRWNHAGTNTTKFNIYSGATILTTDTTNLTVSPHRLITNALSNGTRYFFSVSALNGGRASATSNVATATADSAAPASSRVLTLALTR